VSFEQELAELDGHQDGRPNGDHSGAPADSMQWGPPRPLGGQPPAPQPPAPLPPPPEPVPVPEAPPQSGPVQPGQPDVAEPAALAAAGVAASRSRPAKPPRARRQRPPKAPSRGRSGLMIGLIAVAAVVLLAIPVVLFINSKGGDRLTETSARDNLVPFSFKYPGSWRRQEAGINVVFSPSGRELTTLFSQKGTGDSWNPVKDVLDKDGDAATGLATSFTSTVLEAGTPEQLRDAIQPLLPANATFSSGPEQLLVGGYAADKLEGDLTDPADPGTKLHFMAIVVQVQRPTPKTVYLVFFAPQETFDSKRDLFTKVQQSVDFLS